MATVESLSADLNATRALLSEVVDTIKKLQNKVTTLEESATGSGRPFENTEGFPSSMARDIAPDKFDGRNRNEFKEWFENVSIYMTSVDATAFDVLEWVANTSEVITEAMVREKLLKTSPETSRGRSRRGLRRSRRR